MKRWKDAVVTPETSIKKSLEAIDKVGIQAAVIVDTDNRVLGILTDGDVRRSILKGIDLNGPVSTIMNRTPRTMPESSAREAIQSFMRGSSIRQLPIVDSQGKLVRIDTMDGYFQATTKENFVVLMAGGLGKRLHPLTLDCPKPLLKVGDKPILEIIIENFIKHGFRKFFISVNFKAEMIEAHFKDGAPWGVQVEYLREGQKMGTSGSLSLLPPTPHPVIVMNGDLLTTVDFDQLLNFHIEKESAATMCVRHYEHEIPFGVVSTTDHVITKIEEKPVHQVLINGGIYVLSSEVISKIPAGRESDMPTILTEAIRDGKTVSAFPVREYWLDIGRSSDLARAMDEVGRISSPKKSSS